MHERTTRQSSLSRPTWEALHTWLRERVQGLIQRVLEEEVMGFLGRARYQRLKETWQVEWEAWRRQPLDHLESVYMWADGVYVRAGLETERAAVLEAQGVERAGPAAAAPAGGARRMLREVMYAPTQAEAERKRRAFRAFEEWCSRRSYRQAAETLKRDWQRMVTFYHYPGEHWVHLRRVNVVESPFAALRLQTDAAKRYKRADRATAVI